MSITVRVSRKDKDRIEALRQLKENPKKHENRRETAGEVISRALDALEEEE